MGATAGIRNVINGYVLENKIDNFIKSTDNLETVLSKTGTPPFFAEFGFKYIAGRTEGMFGLIVALNKKPEYIANQNKLLYVEMGGASTQVAFMSEEKRYNASKASFAKVGSQTEGNVKADNK